MSKASASGLDPEAVHLAGIDALYRLSASERLMAVEKYDWLVSRFDRPATQPVPLDTISQPGHYCTRLFDSVSIEDRFETHTFWEKGSGKIWSFADDLDSPAEVEGLGMTFLRTRQEHWKPTTDAVQRFGRGATKNVIVLDREDATAFLRGEDTDPTWDGDWGYLIAAHEIAGDIEPIGVGLYLYDELRLQMPKGRQREF